MNFTSSRVRSRARSFVGLFGTASLGVLAGALGAQAQPSTDIEEVLITGSLIHGAVAVGVPVTSISPQDFKESGAMTVGDLLRTVPAFNIPNSTSAAASSNAIERGTFIDLHSLKGERSLLMVDGMRYPLQSDGANNIDPGIVLQIAVDHVDVLADGASATYGSDALAGVINVIMKRNFDGAMTQMRTGVADAGGQFRWQVAQLYGTKWDGGNVTVAFETNGETALSTDDYWLKYKFTLDFSPWGLDNRTQLISSRPGVVSTGSASASSGTGCTNCYSIPKGTGWNYGDTPAHSNPIGGSSAATLSWSTLLANKGVTNEINPFTLAQLTAPQERNGGTIALDQEVLDGVSVFFDAFYSNRRAVYFSPTHAGVGRNSQTTFIVPTVNPYYPTGAPSGLRVAYSIAAEMNPRISAGEIAKRWAAGFNLDLPYNWNGRIFHSLSDNKTYMVATGLVNLAMASAALGNTVNSVAASGPTPAQAAFTKPANVPFLNVFCDSNIFRCNSPTTLSYISGFRIFDVNYIIHESGINLDGPVYTLPAGDVRAALGIDYNTYSYHSLDYENFNQPNTAIPTNTHVYFHRAVPAAYAQVNVPVVGGDFTLPLVYKLDIEGSYRYDHYYDFGIVNSPKFAFNYSPIEGLTIHGAWGTSFRAPASQHLGLANSQITGQNTLGGGSDSIPICQTGVVSPAAGSASLRLARFLTGLPNPTCAQAIAAAGTNFPGGLGLNSATAGAAPVRPWDGAPLNLGPERATNTSIGVEYAPSFIPGLILEATYYNVHIRDFIFNLSISNGSTLNDPNFDSTYILPDNPRFAQAVRDLLASPISSASTTVQPSNILFISDGAFRNVGFFKVRGVDFRGEYNVDLGDWGAWSAGFSGTYYLHKLTQGVPGTPATDDFDKPGLDAPTSCAVRTHDDHCGQQQLPRLKYRLRLGWTDGTFSVTTFTNFTSHYFLPNNQTFPSAAVLAACTTCGVYSNFQPNFVTFDLTLGYQTGDAPANEYLKNVGLQLVVNDVLDKKAPFAYIVSTQGGNPNAFDSVNGNNIVGRYYTLMVSKSW